MSMRRVDVLVVGGGPAGAVVARGLARRGCAVLVVEAQACARPKPCGEFIAPRGVAVLERSGLLPTVRPLGRELSRLSLVGPGGALSAELTSPALGIRREDLDRSLLAAAEHQAEVWRGRRVLVSERLEGSTVRWRVRLDDRTQIEAGLLIGADGRHSRIRQDAGLGRSMSHTGRHALVVRARGVAHHDGGEMHLGGLGQVGLCPLGPSSSSIVTAGSAPAASAEVNLNLLLSPTGATHLGRVSNERLLRDGLAASVTLADRLRDAVFVGPVLAVAHLRQIPTRVVGANVALVGDAALCSDPFTGEGISNALSDAELLLGCLAAWSGGDAAPALRAYALSHRRMHRWHRIETRILPLLLNHPRIAGALVAGLSRLGLGKGVVGNRHRDHDQPIWQMVGSG